MLSGGRLTDDNRVDLAEELGLSAEAIRACRRIVVVACGDRLPCGLRGQNVLGDDAAHPGGGADGQRVPLP